MNNRCVAAFIQHQGYTPHGLQDKSTLVSSHGSFLRMEEACSVWKLTSTLQRPQGRQKRVINLGVGLPPLRHRSIQSSEKYVFKVRSYTQKMCPITVCWKQPVSYNTFAVAHIRPTYKLVGKVMRENRCKIYAFTAGEHGVLERPNTMSSDGTQPSVNI